MSLWAEKAREQSKRNTGSPADPAPAGGRAPVLQPLESNSLLYHTVAMKAAGLKPGGTCSLLAGASRFKFS